MHRLKLQPRAMVAVAIFLALAACSGDGVIGGHDTAGKQSAQNTASLGSLPSLTANRFESPLPDAFRTMPADRDHLISPIDMAGASTITSTNYITIGKNAYGSVQSINSYSGMPSQCTADLTMGSAATPNFTRQAIDLLMFATTSSPALASRSAQTTACSSGGTMEIAPTLHAAGKISKGDRIALSLSDCQLTPDAHPASGKVAFTFNEIDGTFISETPWKASIDVRFQQLAVLLAADAIVGNGDMTLEITQAGEGKRTVRLRGSRLSEEARLTSAPEIQFARAARTYKDYDAVGMNAGAKSAWTVNYGLTMRSGYFYTAEFAVKTLQPIVFNGGKYPVSGSVKVTGKNSYLTVTAMEGGMARLDFSAKGDGVITETTHLPSTKLLGGNG